MTKKGGANLSLGEEKREEEGTMSYTFVTAKKRRQRKTKSKKGRT